MADDKKNSIDKMRDSAISMRIGTDDDASPISGFVTFSDRMLTVTENRVYEILLADQIDPERANPNVPHAQNCLIRQGSNSEIVSRILLTADILASEHHLRPEITRDSILEKALSLTIKLSRLFQIVEKYKIEEEKAVEKLPPANDELKERQLFQLSEMQDVEASCKDFFVQTKHIIQDLIDLAGCFFPGELGGGFLTNLQKFAKEKYGEKDDLY